MAGPPDAVTCPAPRLAALACLCAGLVLAGCDAEDSSATSSSAASSRPADAWLGRWNGPEGTWLELTAAGGDYGVAIRDLDGERMFPASATPDGIRFERDGEIVELEATDGAGTGMKWLADKADCLVIEPGEGWCRD